MTIEERVRRIVYDIKFYLCDSCKRNSFANLISAELRAAQEEATKGGAMKIGLSADFYCPCSSPEKCKDSINLDKYLEQAMRASRKEGLLKAAEIVEHHRDGKVGTLKTFYAEDRRLAERIRAEAEGLHPKQKPENEDDGQHNQ